MGRDRFPWSSTMLLAIVTCCLLIQPLAEGAREDGAEPRGSLTLQADQATHGRPSQQRIPQDGHYEPHPTNKDTYGLRTEPLSETKRNRVAHDGGDKTVPAAAPPRRKTVRRVTSSRGGKNTTTEKPPKEDDDGDSMAMADAGGKSSSAEDGGSDEKKTLAQQVAEGKYGLIQELIPNTVERPGVISYASNPEVPKDTAENLGGLGQEDIWLAEDHVLVLAGGGFRDKGGGLEQPWPPIDDYIAPRRQVKIPEKPLVPPPFPVQLREGEPPRFIGDDGSPFPPHPDDPYFQNQGNYPTGSGAIQPGPWAGNGSLPAEVPHHPTQGVEPGAPNPQAPIRPEAPGERPPYPPPNYLPYPPPPFPPQNGNFSPPFYPPVPFPPPGNLTEPFDEDDPSLYYPPPYDFYYPSDNSTEIPPGPLVPGIVLPPPPDFFSPLNETSSKGKSPAANKELPVLKKEQESEFKSRGGARPGYRPTMPPKTRITTSTPGPKYLPVTIKARDELSYTTQKQRPLHAKLRPTFPPKVLVQEHPNQVTSAPPLEVIPVTVKSLPIAHKEHTEDVGTGGGRPLEPYKYHHLREKYPSRTNQQTPLYYYNGPGISQIVVTSSPRPIYVEDFYQRPNGVTPEPPKSPKKQIIYIFTSPEQQDVLANQVSSTEFPQALRDHHKYEYGYEDERQPKSQGDKQRYRQDVPTPPRLENFHSYYDGSNGQFYDFLPSPVDPVSSRGFRFPDEVEKGAPATVTPRPSNYYLDDINSDIQRFRQLGFGQEVASPKPVVYYPVPSSNGEGNKTHEGINQAHGLGGQAHVPQKNNFNVNPVTYRPHVHHANQHAHRGNEDVTIVTPKPAPQYLDPTPINGGRRIPPHRGNGGISIITVKPSVLYSGPVSAQGGQQTHGETNLDSNPVVIPRPSAYYTNPVVSGGAHQNIPKIRSNPSVSIVTPKPQVYNSGTPSPGYYHNHAQGNGRVRITQSARYRVQPLSGSQNPSTFHSVSDGTQVILGQNANSNGEQGNPYPHIYFANAASSTPPPPKLQDGNQYIFDYQSGGGHVTSTTPRAPKYIDITHEDAQILNDPRKKTPTAQYEEYFEANRSPSQLSHINYDRGVSAGVYIQSTTPPTVQTTSRPLYNPQETQFASYNQRIPNVQNNPYSQEQSPRQPLYVTQQRPNNNRNQGIYDQSTPSPPLQPFQYQSQLSQIGQVNGQKQGPQEEIYIQTTPAPIQYHYAVSNQPQNNRVTTPAPDFASVFNYPSSTFSPLPSYYTTQDVHLFDDVTRNYFTIFGQKIGGQGKAGESSEGPRLRPTTPLPPLAEEFNGRGEQEGLFPTSRPTAEAPEEHTVVSLEDDIRVNFRNPLPPINPDSEFIVPVRSQPPAPRPLPSPTPATQSAVRGGGAVVSYQLPGVDGKGVGGGSHYYFLTPQPVSSDTRPRPFQQNNGYYQQGQRPVFNNYWTRLRSR